MNESLKKKIEIRAYQLFLKRGGAHGYHVQDWAKAEKEILAEESGARNDGAQKNQAAPKPAQPKKTQAQSRK
jgi:hypothetical protein